MKIVILNQSLTWNYLNLESRIKTRERVEDVEKQFMILNHLTNDETKSNSFKFCTSEWPVQKRSSNSATKIAQPRPQRNSGVKVPTSLQEIKNPETMIHITMLPGKQKGFLKTKNWFFSGWTSHFLWLSFFEL